MAFLTKKEQSLIGMINSNNKLSAEQRTKMIDEVKYNARLRSDGHKPKVREFLQHLAIYNTGKILNAIK